MQCYLDSSYPNTRSRSRRKMIKRKNNSESSDNEPEIKVSINPKYRKYSRFFRMNKRKFNQNKQTKRRYVKCFTIRLFTNIQH